MLKQKFILLLGFAIQLKIITCEIQKVPCVMSQNNQNCTIFRLATLTLKNYKFIPVVELSTGELFTNVSVINFELKKSLIPVITIDICTAFPKLKTFIAANQGIEIIEDYAFNNCTEVTIIRIPFNNIHKLGKGIFSKTNQLQELSIHGASLEQVDVDLFSSLSEMVKLLFTANGLKELPLDAVKNMKKLKTLYIYSNDLTDLDADGFIQNLPNLKEIYLNDNSFQCDRLMEIIKAFKAKNISVNTFSLNTHMKKRDYVPGNRYNIICLTQAQKKIEDMKRALTTSLDELKEYPIGKAVIQLNDIVHSGFADSDSNIEDLFNTLNKTAENLNEQLSLLKETVERNFKKMQEISMMTVEDTNRGSLSLGHVIAIWIFLSLLTCIVAATIFFVNKKLRHAHLDGITMSYKTDAALIDHEEHHFI